MAEIVRGFKTLKKGQIQFGIALAVCITAVIYLVITLRGWPRLLAIIPFAGSLFSLRLFAGYSSGLNLEGRITSIIRELPDDFKAVQDITIERDDFGRPVKINHLLFAPRGIFLIETKHRQGRIISKGDEWHQYWVRDHNIFANPVSEVEAKAAFLREKIKEESHRLMMSEEEVDNLFIQPLIVFSNEEVELKVVAEKVPVFRLDEFEKYIQSFKKKVVLSPEKRDALIPFVLGLNLDA